MVENEIIQVAISKNEIVQVAIFLALLLANRYLKKMLGKLLVRKPEPKQEGGITTMTNEDLEALIKRQELIKKAFWGN